MGACVQQSTKSSEPFTRHTGGFGNGPNGDTEELHNEMEAHIESVHHGDIDVETGATLASGTTIAGNTSFHAGNDGPASGLSADDVDGSEPPFANSDLSNTSVTLAGQSVTLGGSNTLGLSNLDDTDLNGSTLVNSVDGFVDVGGNDFRLGIGQAIEGGGGTKRVLLNSDRTAISAPNGNQALSAQDVGLFLFGYESQGITFRDQQGGFEAVNYISSASTPGTLKLTSADLDMSGNIVTDSAGLLSLSSGASGEAATINLNANSGSDRFAVVDSINANNTFVVERTGLVEVPRGNLRLATGQAIEDGGGDPRLRIDSNLTAVNFDNGARAIELESGVRTQVNSFTGAPFIIRDTEGGFDSVTHITSNSSPSTLELTNAVIDAPSEGVSTFGDITNSENLPLRVQSGGGRAGIRIENDDGGEGKLFVDLNGDLQYEDPSGAQTQLN